MKLKELHFADVAEIQKAVADELKNAQHRNFRQLFRNRTTAQKPLCILTRSIPLCVITIGTEEYSLAQQYVFKLISY
jgi:hypothetical protein